MTEVEKMRSSRLADMAVPEIQERFAHAKALLARMGGMSTYEDGYRKLLEELVPGIPETSIICPPFHCDHGRARFCQCQLYISGWWIYYDWCSYVDWPLCADLHSASSDGLSGKKRL